ncbi:prolyl-tRNA synthetase [Streptomyces achromogenes]|nr:prolyl-tRNA synthetase [Streptomyces achromogenes]
MGAAAPPLPADVRILWQEGHTAHATYEEARDFAARVQREVYGDFLENVFAIDFVAGRKTVRERFAGAVNTLTLESMTGDGKALQMVTSHELGQNFAKAFDTRYLSKDGTRELVWQTSRGSTTRMIGALVMTHGDDDGLRVPPRLAQIQVVVLAVADDEAVLAKVRELGGRLAAAGLRVRVDDRTDVPLGRRAVDWELKGVPVRVEIGPRNLADGTAMLVRRIPGYKEAVAVDALAGLLPVVLEEDQALLLRQSRERRESRTADVSTVGEAVEAVGADGWARVPWAALGEEGEAALAEQSLTVRCLVAEDGAVPDDEDAPGNVAVVARAC